MQDLRIVTHPGRKLLPLLRSARRRRDDAVSPRPGNQRHSLDRRLDRARLPHRARRRAAFQLDRGNAAASPDYTR